MRRVQFVAAICVVLATASSGVLLAPDVAAAGAHRVKTVPITTQVLVVGDSVGASLVPGIGHAGIRVVDGTRSGCRFLPGKIRNPTRVGRACPWPSSWKREVKALRPKVVVLMPGAGDLLDVRPPGAARWLAPGSRPWARYYGATLERAADVLGSTGAKVVIPTIPYSSAPGAGRNDSERVRFANRVIARTAAEKPTRLAAPDLNRYLSPTGTSLDVTGVLTDGLHFSPVGANLVGSWLAPQLAPPLRGSVRKHRRSGPVRVLLVGDSITVNYQNPTAAMLEAKGYEVSRTGVPQSSLLDAGVCDGTYAQGLLTYADPDVVVFENNGNYGLQPGIDPCAPRVEPGSDAFYKQWRSAARLNQKVLTSRGAAFLWVLSPSVNFAPKRAMIPKINSIYRRLAGTRHGLIDGWNALGGRKFDPRFRYDNQHLSGAGRR